jgi:tetratricopeptide (TPR) repeat protein
LGKVALAQGRWEQAEQYYQQALQIYIEYNDRYEQAGTYHQFGRVAEEQQQWEQAEKQFLQALQIFLDFSNNENVAIVVGGLARLWHACNDASLLERLGTVLKKTPEETRDLLQSYLDTVGKPDNSSVAEE